MGRMPMIAGNWKMYKTPGEGAVLVQDHRRSACDDAYWRRASRSVVCPPFTGLKPRRDGHRARQAAPSKLGAQNVHWEDEGAFTGEISPRDARRRSAATTCIVGHSERREFFGETDETVNKKVKALFAARDHARSCAAARRSTTRDAGETDAFVRAQVRAGARRVSTPSRPPSSSSPTSRSGRSAPAARPRPRRPTTSAARSAPPSARCSASPPRSSVRVLYGGSAKPENIGDVHARARHRRRARRRSRARRDSFAAMLSTAQGLRRK